MQTSTTPLHPLPIPLPIFLQRCLVPRTASIPLSTPCKVHSPQPPSLAKVRGGGCPSFLFALAPRCTAHGTSLLPYQFRHVRHSLPSPPTPFPSIMQHFQAASQAGRPHEGLEGLPPLEAVWCCACRFRGCRCRLFRRVGVTDSLRRRRGLCRRLRLRLGLLIGCLCS